MKGGELFLCPRQERDVHDVLCHLSIQMAKRFLVPVLNISSSFLVRQKIICHMMAVLLMWVKLSNTVLDNECQVLCHNGSIQGNACSLCDFWKRDFCSAWSRHCATIVLLPLLSYLLGDGSKYRECCYRWDNQKLCLDAGADGISMINTLMGMRIDLKTKKPS